MERPILRIVRYSDGSVQVEQVGTPLVVLEFKGAPNELLDDKALVRIGRAAAVGLIDEMAAEGIWEKKPEDKA